MNLLCFFTLQSSFKLSLQVSNTMMKFEDFLIHKDETMQKRLDLEQEVEELQAMLQKEKRLNEVLQCVIDRKQVSRTCHSSELPVQVQVLLAELAMVEEEIIWLEREVDELKLYLYHEKHQWQNQQQTNFQARLQNWNDAADNFQEPVQVPKAKSRRQKAEYRKNASFGSVSEIKNLFHTRKNGDRHQISRKFDGVIQARSENPNKISEELITFFIKIFHQLQQESSAGSNYESSSMTPRIRISCMSSVSKSNCKTFMNNNSDGMMIPLLDAHSMLPDPIRTVRVSGPYKKFVQFTERSFDVTHVSSDCISDIKKTRKMINELCVVDVSLLTYKQKLAFWVNIYNACIMQAFLHYGVPQTQDKLLGFMNKATVNVGGVLLNALAIEHIILRNLYQPKNEMKECMDDKENFLRHAYGLGYPEPNVAFALCRGSWSSPALRVYTGEGITNELEKAKVDYLEATIRITRKKKIVLPKLLHWHMYDFADDIDSLLEWIYSQLPREGSLKREMMECLMGEKSAGTKRLVEIQPYESEFCYLLPP